MKRPPFLSIALMSFSLLLLLLFQALWLRSVYDDQYEALHKETDAIFRNTMMDVQDSLVRKNMKLVAKDSSLGFPLPFLPPGRSFPGHAPDRVFVESHRKAHTDTIREQARVQISISSDQRLDSTHKLLGSIAENVNDLRKRNGNYNFVVRLNLDSLPVQSITQRYRQALAKADIPLPFRIVRSTARPSPPPHRREEFRTIPFLSFPVDTHYWASFPEYQGYLLQKCIPQGLFSVFLTLITSVSFFLIYRNFQRQRSLNQLKNDFVNNITHELKTPITTVGVAMEALSHFNVLQNPAQAHEYLGIARQELNRLNLMVDKLLKTAVFESKGIDIQWDTVDMKALLDQIQHSMQLHYEKAHARVTYTWEGEAFGIKGDAIHLTNVLYNLIDNALKYTQAPPAVTILLRDLGDKVELSVTDNGIGIASEFQQKIFEKFFRVPTGNVHNATGYGLGLNYVAQVVDKHHGQIRVQSAPGKGSCFTICLPKSDA